MKILKKSLLFLILPLLAFATAHKFYVSVTSVNYSEKDSALQITSRIFIDDFETVLQERYGFEAQLATAKESKEADSYIEKYLRTKVKVEINGANASFDFIGKTYDDDVMVCYIEVPNVDLAHVTSIQIENEVLTDIFDEQQNILHFKIEGHKKSFVLIKSDTKAMLNL
ncbi:hypothetical protein LCGC14_0947580 [marine sediment metagenome]|uniref:Peptidase E n=2 Tax=root TaxID=1 RepID=A0A831QK08_9FLAO|nr:hypothetical protein [Pricia antarctica]